MIWALLTLLALFIIASCYCIKFALIILRVKDALEDSLEKIDESYFKISEILNIPIFYNSKEVKIVIDEIKNSRDSLLLIASSLSTSIEEETDE